MTRPTVVSGRFFQRLSDRAWLARVDTQSGLSTAEAEQHCAAEYGFSVRAIETDLPAADFDAFVATHKVAAVRPPVPPPPPLTAGQQAYATATATDRMTLVAKRVGLVP